MPVVFTADCEGHISVCDSCRSGRGDGGLARRAAAVRQLRDQSPILLLDAGNTFFGGDSEATESRLILDAYRAMHYDAVNVSYRDFRNGLAATRQLLAGGKLPVISANLLDEKTGRPLFEPFVVKEFDHQRVAIIGLTELPPGIDQLPQLKKQLAGIRVRPPAEALAEWLPVAKQRADRVLLLYYGTDEGVAVLQKQFGADLAAIGVGGTSTSESPQDSVPAQIRPQIHGKSIEISSAQW